MKTLVNFLHEIKLASKSIDKAHKREYLAYVAGFATIDSATEKQLSDACKAEKIKPKTLENKLSIIRGAVKKYPSLDLNQFDSFKKFAPFRATSVPIPELLKAAINNAAKKTRTR